MYIVYSIHYNFNKKIKYMEYTQQPQWLKEQEEREKIQTREMIVKELRKFERTEKARQKREDIAKKKEIRGELLNRYKSYIGKKGVINIENLKIEVKIIDFKQSFGNFRYLITPLAGSGEIWTEKVIFN